MTTEPDEPTDKEIWLVELEDEKAELEEALFLTNRESQKDRYIRLDEQIKAINKRIAHAREMPE